MSESTLLEPQQTQENKIESALERMQDDTQEASADLLPLVYAELRKLAESRLAAEPAGQTLQPTALVHEAYLRLTKKRTLKSGTVEVIFLVRLPLQCAES